MLLHRAGKSGGVRISAAEFAFMESVRASGNPTWRIVVVIGLSLILVLIEGVNFRRLVIPIGVFGYGTNLDGVVTGVTSGSPAAKAGLQVGDRIDTTSMNPQELEELLQFPNVASAGLVRTIGYYRGGERHSVAMTSVPEPMGPAEGAIIVMQFLAALVCIAIGAVVVLLRPEPATWGFFIFCLGFAPVDELALTASTYQTMIPQVAELFIGLLTAAAVVGLLIFAFRFLTPSLPRWRRAIQSAFPVIFLSLATLNVLETYNTYVVYHPAEWIARALLALSTLCYVLVVVALVDTYVHRTGADRQRIRWVVWGFAAVLLASVAGAFITTEVTDAPLILGSALSLVAALAPLAVAYAVVKHRVIDINFVISRTLVYGALTALFVVIFALIDWLVGHVLDQTRWALIAEIAVAIGVGFWLNGLHHRVDELVDSVLFRRRHEAERRLARLARGLPHATTTELVESMIVREPLDALELASAALFRRNRSGRYDRAASTDWPAVTITFLDPSDPLIPYLEGERGAMRLSEVHWSSADVPTGAARPVLALPIMLRHRLEAVVLYGAHKGGEDFDPDELQWLNALAVAAGAAFDHLEAEALHKKLDEVMRERESWRLVLERHGWLPAGSP